MVNYKNIQDNLPDTVEGLDTIVSTILKEKVENNPRYHFTEFGINIHSGTKFSSKCLINVLGCLVIKLLEKDYNENEFYHTSFFNKEIQQKLNNYLNEKTNSRTNI